MVVIEKTFERFQSGGAAPVRLVARDLGIARGGRPVLSGLALSLAGGGALAVTGPNGSGKTTLLRLLAGLLRPDRGSIAVEPAEEAAMSERSHLIGHRDGVKDGLTAAENLAVARDLLGGPRAPVAPALAAIGLAHAGDLPAAILSAGQRRRLALGRLLVAPRPVWLLDEPLNALDAAGRTLLAGLVAAHRAAGGIVVAATHAELGWPDLARIELEPAGR